MAEKTRYSDAEARGVPRYYIRETGNREEGLRAFAIRGYEFRR